MEELLHLAKRLALYFHMTHHVVMEEGKYFVATHYYVESRRHKLRVLGTAHANGRVINHEEEIAK